MEILVETYGKTIINIVGALAILGMFILAMGVGMDAPQHTFTESEVGTTVTLADEVTFLGETMVPAITYDVDEYDVGCTVSLGQGLFGRTMYLVFNVMLEQK